MHTQHQIKISTAPQRHLGAKRLTVVENDPKAELKQPVPSGLSRAELRKIVIELIG